MANYTWISCVDAVTGLELTFNASHIVMVRSGRQSTAYVRTVCGFEYEVEGTRAALMAALTGKSEGEL